MADMMRRLEPERNRQSGAPTRPKNGEDCRLLAARLPGRAQAVISRPSCPGLGFLDSATTETGACLRLPKLLVENAKSLQSQIPAIIDEFLPTFQRAFFYREYESSITSWPATQ